MKVCNESPPLRPPPSVTTENKNKQQQEEERALAVIRTSCVCLAKLFTRTKRVWRCVSCYFTSTTATHISSSVGKVGERSGAGATLETAGSDCRHFVQNTTWTDTSVDWLNFRSEDVVVIGWLVCGLRHKINWSHVKYSTWLSILTGVIKRTEKMCWTNVVASVEVVKHEAYALTWTENDLKLKFGKTPREAMMTRLSYTYKIAIYNHKTHTVHNSPSALFTTVEQKTQWRQKSITNRNGPHIEKHIINTKTECINH